MTRASRAAWRGVGFLGFGPHSGVAGRGHGRRRRLTAGRVDAHSPALVPGIYWMRLYRGEDIHVGVVTELPGKPLVDGDKRDRAHRGVAWVAVRHRIGSAGTIRDLAATIRIMGGQHVLA